LCSAVYYKNILSIEVSEKSICLKSQQGCISLALPPLSGPAEVRGVEETPLFSPPALGTKAVLNAEEIRFVPFAYTVVIRFVSTNAKFGTCTVDECKCVKGKMFTFKGE
jgi:hypothetical protein